MKSKIIIGNNVAVIRLDAVALQLVADILYDAGYGNLVREIIDNTTIEKHKPTIVETETNG